MYFPIIFFYILYFHWKINYLIALLLLFDTFLSPCIAKQETIK